MYLEICSIETLSKIMEKLSYVLTLNIKTRSKYFSSRNVVLSVEYLECRKARLQSPALQKPGMVAHT